MEITRKISTVSINGVVSNLLQISFGFIILFLSAFVYIYIPGNPVPITLQVFSVLMIGSLFSKKNGIISTLTYLVVGASGAPVFAGASSGLLHLFGPTGGYLLGFIAAVYIIGTLQKKAGLFLSLFLGVLSIYFLGWLQLSIFMKMDFIKALYLGVFTFIPYDIIKLILAYFILKKKRGI